MKKKYFFLTFVVSVWAYAQTRAVIYSMRIKVDPALVEEVKISTNKPLTGSFSFRECFPDTLTDFIIAKSEEILSRKFGVPFEAFYSYYKNGKKITTMGVYGELEGLPDNTYKKTVSSISANYYALIDAHLTGGGDFSIEFANGSVSKIKPQISVTVKVFDSNKKKVYARTVTLKKFGKLRSKTEYLVDPRTGKTWAVKTSETLSPMDVVLIYLSGLEHNLFENK
ncbi:MAG: hypothetical protein N2Z72_03230 [Bacteroidales bacterium]|nr:hypothetical protein [Bacteroidales bacterium]